MNARVTIIIPCYHHGHLLAEAVESALAQTHRELEIVIIDDGSTDATRAVAENFVRAHPATVNYLYQENRGQALARQRGLEAATGRFCLTLDADDLLEREAAEACLLAFENHPEADAIVGNALIVGPDGRRILRTHTQTNIVSWPDVLKRNPYGVNLGVMTRTSALRAAGGLAGARPGCEDWDTWARMTRCGMIFAPVEAILGRYRQTGQNHTRAVLANLEAYLEMLATAAGEDPRLAAAGRIVAPPIASDLHDVYRNGRVFHAFGLALGYGLPEADWAALAARLSAGMLFAPWCTEQFTEGLAFAWAQAAENKPEIPLRAFLKILAPRLSELGHAGDSDTLRAGLIHAVRQVTGARSLFFITQKLREKLTGRTRTDTD